MKRAGELLVEARNKKGLTLEEVEKETNIRKRVLQTLEEGDWEVLAPAYAKGLLKNYAKFLDIDEKKVLAFFRRDYDERKQATTVKKLESPGSRLRFTPAAVTVLLISILVLGVFFYLFSQYRSFTAAPKLEIFEPKNNTKLSAPQVNVVGKTYSDAILKINGEKVQVSPGGTFSVSVSLKEGINEINITAENRFGKVSTEKKVVVVDLADEKARSQETPAALKLQLSVPKKSTFIEITVDGKQVFAGLMLAGSSKSFEAREKIKVTTENAGSTLVKIDEEEFYLGKEGEKVDREFTLLD